METMNRFFRHAYLSFKALFGWLNPKVYLLVMVVNPLSQLVFFAILANYVYQGQGLSGYVASNALLLCVMNSVFGIMSVVTSDRRMGTLQIVVASPANKVSLFIARSVFHILNGSFTALIGLIFGMVIFQLSFSLEQLLFLLYVWFISIFAACGLGLILASFTLWTPSVNLWANALASLLLLFSGANYAREIMPEWMYVVSEFFPLTRGVEATKLIMSNEATLTYINHLMLQEIILGVFFYVIGIVMFFYAEFIARRKGTLELD